MPPLRRQETRGERGGRKTAETFLSRFRGEVQQSQEQLKAIQALMAEKGEGVVEGELASLLPPVLGPMSTTLSSLIPSAVVSSFTPLTSSLSSSSVHLAASLLAAKRGRGRLQKCEKHRRWKKRCPSDCPDKPINAATAEGEEEGEDEEDEEEGEGEGESKAKKEGGKRKSEELGRDEEKRMKRAACEATVVQVTSSSPLPPPAPHTVAQPVEAVRAYEPTLATSVHPNASLSLTSPTPQRSTVVLSHSVTVAHAGPAPHPLPGNPAALYSAQPLVLPSHPSTPLYAYPPSTFPNPNAYQPTTLVTLDHLNAMGGPGGGQHLRMLPGGGNAGAYPMRAPPAQPHNVLYHHARPPGPFPYHPAGPGQAAYQMR